MKQNNSKHFRFFIVDSLAFNAYSVGKLESFIDTAMRRLEYSAEDMRQLESAKIFYFACKDEKEIEEFTGYNTSGLYFLPYDYLITRFNCHYHELLHLLINFKLKHLPLYTNPFLQEGFAVAFGGRAGKEPEVINETGKFLIQSHFQEYQPLLQTGEFRNTDPSIAYPVAGIYNLFLFNRLGTEKYLKLYKKYSGQTDAVSWQGIDPLDLPSATDWERFLQEFENSQPVSFPAATNPAVQISGGRSGGIVQTGDYLFICLRDTMLLRGQNSLSLFYSSKFAELFPGRKYNGEKYAVLADTGEISVYNLFTGNLIAKYSLSFSLTGKPVPKENGLYQFLIKKSCFDEIPEVE
jgi:hypothetical protein